MMSYNYIPIFCYDKLNQHKYKKKTKEYSKTLTWTTLAWWSMKHKNIHFNLRAFGWTYRNRIGYGLYRKIICTLTHETIHGIIQKVMEKDSWSGEFDPEWPMKNGMDSNYARTMKKLNGYKK